MADKNPPNQFEIQDVEEYRGDEQQQFSHQSLVMDVMRRMIESGSHEMREGWTNEKLDNTGNIIRTYIEDTRKKFIESVKTAKMVMVCDFDTAAKEKIEAHQKSIDSERDKLLEWQWAWYEQLPPLPKQTWSGKISKTFFNSELNWYLHFIEIELKYHRLIAEELTQLTKRLEFYTQESFEA